MDQDQSQVGSPVEGEGHAGATPPADPSQQSPEELRQGIAQTREELGDTVEALSAKTDFKAQAQARVDEAKERVSERKDEILGKARQATPQSASQGASQVAGKARQNPVPTAAIGAFVAGFVLGRLTSRGD